MSILVAIAHLFRRRRPAPRVPMLELQGPRVVGMWSTLSRRDIDEWDADLEADRRRRHRPRGLEVPDGWLESRDLRRAQLLTEED